MVPRADPSRFGPKLADSNATTARVTRGVAHALNVFKMGRPLQGTICRLGLR